MSIFRLGDQQPPEPQRITDAVVMRFEHVYEVDPALMEEFPQQDIPAWDTQRIVDSRWEHLDWMHNHFADEVLLAGAESETMPPDERALPSEEESGPRDAGAQQGDLETPAAEPPDVRG